MEFAAGRRLHEAGVIELRDGRLRVERPLLTDEVSRAILAIAPPGIAGADRGKIPSDSLVL